MAGLARKIINPHTASLPLTDKGMKSLAFKKKKKKIWSGGISKLWGLEFSVARGEPFRHRKLCALIGRVIGPISYAPIGLWGKYGGWRINKSERMQLCAIRKHQTL